MRGGKGKARIGRKGWGGNGKRRMVYGKGRIIGEGKDGRGREGW